MFLNELAGELLIFEYSPKLVIVGTYHSLCEEDKRTLDGLIEENDFVALELDEHRVANNYGVKVMMELFPKKRGYDTDDGSFHYNPVDAAYLYLQDHLTARRTLRINEKIAADYGVSRDTEQDEFLYCLEKARSLGKDTYLVDMPLQVRLEKLADLPAAAKIMHIASLVRGMEEPFLVRHLLRTEREDLMLQNIAAVEGNLSYNHRRGILVVGGTHAVNYFTRLHS
jgi:hypothetical protein